MTILVPLPAESFATFFDRAAAGYAADNVASGRWSADEALQLARSEGERLLPQGVATPDNYFYEIKASADGDTVGQLWFAALPRGSQRIAYLFQIEVYPDFRRRGHARAALRAFESLAAELGLSGTALNVFGSNKEAQTLYAAAGYSVTSISMHKSLPRNGA
jgi:ribosomal protein S18 acetylase RimI-like enzyme